MSADSFQATLWLLYSEYNKRLFVVWQLICVLNNRGITMPWEEYCGPKVGVLSSALPVFLSFGQVSFFRLDFHCSHCNVSRLPHTNKKLITHELRDSKFLWDQQKKHQFVSWICVTILHLVYSSKINFIGKKTLAIWFLKYIISIKQQQNDFLFLDLFSSTWILRAHSQHNFCFYESFSNSALQRWQ